MRFRHFSPFAVLEIDHPLKLVAEAKARQEAVETIGGELRAVGHYALSRVGGGMGAGGERNMNHTE